MPTNQAPNEASPDTRYRGRFAPTPSGPLHLGSLLTALAGWLCARRARGLWHLRIDDLDQARCASQSVEQILHQLEAHGLTWDGPIRYQHDHLPEYQAALQTLIDQQQVYACQCSRAQLARRLCCGADAAHYDGHCRNLGLPFSDHALRARLRRQAITYVDGWQGVQPSGDIRALGDFVLKRRDGVFSYQLSCAVDEIALGITEVVRGADLMDSTLAQLWVLDALAAPRPAYRHLPVLTDPGSGQKLSKQNHAVPLDCNLAGENLWRCLFYLRQSPPAQLRHAPVQTILQWAVHAWQPQKVPGVPDQAVEPSL
ncbi:tRNA glutamyl-Q(34) synthetase GluQRS [Sinimarinibacterium sp. NLF-5-8]|uniref:tRNA glutamyl-Q(34) synthetase GluQRS n=1 Tax=Sinimarinibacterium sp. NLF-5-8 TaxID=2698684 RepID=UPI00137BB07B|nr:tRNA glutamyl-Q(34) synthetase GluQRS [Sinimarinibacterium sp. NLF-5-8]QHS09879.1 tRNA glutamyl-Q(34) synthetase GluQRS [Sinimarinibacterium sp. NLF-5-8]